LISSRTLPYTLGLSGLAAPPPSVKNPVNATRAGIGIQSKNTASAAALGEVRPRDKPQISAPKI